MPWTETLGVKFADAATFRARRAWMVGHHRRIDSFVRPQSPPRRPNVRAEPPSAQIRPARPIWSAPRTNFTPSVSAHGPDCIARLLVGGAMLTLRRLAPARAAALAWAWAARPVGGRRFSAQSGRQPAPALAVQVLQVVPRQRHPVEEHFELGVGLGPDRLHLALIAVATSLRFQKRPERPDITLAQDVSELGGVRVIVGGHRRGSGGPDQPAGGPGW